MKKIGLIVVFLAVCGILSLPVVNVQGDVSLVDNYIKSEMVKQINAAFTILNGVIDSSNKLDGAQLANDSVAAASIGVISVSDTNDNTVATSYTPAYVGQILVGSVGAGTNGVWVSKGTTTNDWVGITLN